MEIEREMLAPRPSSVPGMLRSMDRLLLFVCVDDGGDDGSRSMGHSPGRGHELLRSLLICLQAEGGRDPDGRWELPALRSSSPPPSKGPGSSGPNRPESTINRPAPRGQATDPGLTGSYDRYPGYCSIITYPELSTSAQPNRLYILLIVHYECH